MADDDSRLTAKASPSRMKTIWENLIVGHPAIVVGVLLAIVLIQGLSALSGSVAGAPTSSDGFQQAEVVRVVDGDTLLVRLDGREERVRLIGINCPESVAPEEERNSQEGREASQFTKQLVGSGDTVWLESDTNDRDQYDRLLRYVWLEKPENPNNESEIAEKMLNGVLVANGYAEARRYGADTAHSDVLERLERKAAEEGRGISDFWN